MTNIDKKSMLKIITLSLHNRYEYADQVLTYLSQCEGIKDYIIIPVIDNDIFYPNQARMTAVLHKYAEAKLLNIDQPRFHEENVGCNGNIYTCLNIGFQLTDFLIHIEDDIILAKDALEYFEWANAKYKDDLDVFTVDGYNNEQHQDFPSAYATKRAKSFKPWGWATWRDRWLDIKDRWQFDYSRRPDLPQGGGWDVCMKHALRGDKSRIYPLLSRVKNIGAHGLHTPSPEWHSKKHNIQLWADDYKGIKGEFYELEGC